MVWFSLDVQTTIRLMSARAKYAELPSWTSGEPAGSMFLGSKDFPPSMVEAVSDLDPAALLMGCMFPQDSFLAERTAQDWAIGGGQEDIGAFDAENPGWKTDFEPEWW